MGWWIISTGVILLLIGIFGKIKEYEDYGDYKDFQNLTTKSRYLKDNTEDKISDDKAAEEVAEKAAEKQHRLEEINHNLDRIIQEISAKEKIIKQSLNDIAVEGENLSLKNEFKEILDNTSANMSKKNLPEKHKKIINMSKEGFNKEDIADKLNIGVRETALILRMHKRGADND